MARRSVARCVGGGLLAVGLLVPALVAAQDATPAEVPAASAAASSAPSDRVRRDPKGVKGISPFWESIKLGDSAHLARDHDKAILQYREAITKEPQNPVGHLRIAEAFLGKGALPEALESIAAATRFADNEPSMKARALFLTALLQERQKNFDQAADAWKVYQQFGREQPKAKVHQRTPPERLKRIQIAKQLSVDYAAVKERIAKRLKEADEAIRKNAK